jgi:hypothetical protein
MYQVSTARALGNFDTLYCTCTPRHPTSDAPLTLLRHTFSLYILLLVRAKGMIFHVLVKFKHHIEDHRHNCSKTEFLRRL